MLCVSDTVRSWTCLPAEEGWCGAVTRAAFCRCYEAAISDVRNFYLFLFVCLFVCLLSKKIHDLFFLAFSQFLRVRSGAISFNRVESNGFFCVLRRCGSQFLDNVLADVVGPASEPAQASQGSDNLAQMFGSNLNSMLICICLSCQHVACSFASWVCLSVFIWLHQLKCR